MTTTLNKWADQIRVIEEFAEAKPDGIEMYDFGDSTTVMPVPDLSEGGTYLTSSMCVLVRRGEGSFEWQIPFGRSSGNVVENKGVVELPNGWRFISVEFGTTTTPEELKKRIYEAKEKLLAVP